MASDLEGLVGWLELGQSEVDHLAGAIACVLYQLEGRALGGHIECVPNLQPARREH